MTPGEIFSQPFTQLFGPTPPVFEGFKSLNVNDIIQWLVLLVCLFCLAFRDKGRLTWITTLIPTLENKDAIISGPVQAQVSAVAKELREEIREKMEEVTEKMEEMMRRNSSHVAPVRVTGPRVRAQQPPARERGYTPRADLWYFLRDHGEDMGRWDGKPTSALAARVRELKERNTNRGGPTKMKIASTSHDQAASQGEARENRVYWMVWIRWPGTSEPQKYEALVDTGSQCTLIPSEYEGTEPISIAGVTVGITGIDSVGSQGEPDREGVAETSNCDWPRAPRILGIDFLRNGYYKDSKGLKWAFGIAAVEAEVIKKLNNLPGLLENPSAVELLKAEEQQVPVATSTVHLRQYRTN
ncbi:hypothetical protein DUI87_27077 [Hirundo rustica rustica]|uniref:Peptidase A2 domain-containing protein n=1 Tax=Hirundo rustica rustica TaxID=333673 RepID=A0A3M0J6F2_HIRRU|nr:hypothetical protein DUI87_27077 [Hirundo rustica rustica]